MRWIPALFLLLPLALSVSGETPRAPSPEAAARHHFLLALRGERDGEPAVAVRHYLAVLAVEPEHPAARRALGRGGRGVADAALALLWRPDAAQRAAGLRALALLDAAERARAWRIAARNRRADVRLAAVRALGDPGVLARAALLDADGAVRAAALESLRRSRVEHPARYVLPALRAATAAVRMRALHALAALGDAEAVGPLIQRLQVSGGSGQQVYISQTNQISYVQDFDVEVASTAFIADPTVGVLQDGVSLAFRALSNSGTLDIYERRATVDALRKLTGKDLEGARAWRAWYLRSRRGAQDG